MIFTIKVLNCSNKLIVQITVQVFALFIFINMYPETVTVSELSAFKGVMEV